jgi:CBS domain-containing protein
MFAARVALVEACHEANRGRDDPRGVEIAPAASIRSAAQLMAELEVGALPVCDGSRLIGRVTDRDITVRCVAHGLAAVGST